MSIGCLESLRKIRKYFRKVRSLALSRNSIRNVIIRRHGCGDRWIRVCEKHPLLPPPPAVWRSVQQPPGPHCISHLPRWYVIGTGWYGRCEFAIVLRERRERKMQGERGRRVAESDGQSFRTLCPYARHKIQKKISLYKGYKYRSRAYAFNVAKKIKKKIHKKENANVAQKQSHLFSA